MLHDARWIVVCLTSALTMVPIRAFAQSGQAPVPIGQVGGLMPLPVPLQVPGPFRRMRPLQWTPEKVLDAVLLDGDKVTVALSPGYAQSYVPLAGSTLDVAVFPAASPDGLDAIARVGSTWSGVRLTWVEGIVPVSSTVSMPAFAGARLLQVADVNADGFADLVGLAADGRTVQTILTSGHVHGTFASGPGFTALQDVEQFEVLNWSADVGVEVACLGPSGIHFYNLDLGVLVASVRNFLPGRSIAVVRQSGQNLDRLCWVTQVGNSEKIVLIDSDPGDESRVKLEGPVTLPGVQVAQVRAGDQDQDGDDDLYASLRSSRQLLRIENERSPAQPEGDSFATFHLSYDDLSAQWQQTDPGNEAWPAIGDFEMDGDLDAFTPIESSQALVRVDNALLDAALAAPLTLSMGFRLPVDGADHSTLELFLGEGSQHPPAATHVEAILWLQDDLASPLANTAVSYLLQPVGVFPLELIVDLPEVSTSFGDRVYFLELRYVTEVGGERFRSHPTLVGGISLDPDIITVLASRVGAGPVLSIVQIVEYPDGAIGEPVIVGGFVPQATLPLYTTDDIPDPGS